MFKSIKGVFIGTLVILLAYAILPKSWQFSRLFIFVGAGWTILYYILSRIFLHFTIGKRYKLRLKATKSFGVINDDDSEVRRIEELIRHTNDNISNIDKINTKSIDALENGDYNELIFSAKNQSYTEIIDWMSHLNFDQTDYKIAPDSENYLIGSNSIDTAGELYILNLNTLVSKENKRKKRLFDVIFSFSAVILSPFIIWNFNRKSSFLKNMIQILIGRSSFIGFSEVVSKKDVRLPKIKPGLLVPGDIMDSNDPQINEKLNLLYARDYSMRKDFSILLKAWNKLDE